MKRKHTLGYEKKNQRCFFSFFKKKPEFWFGAKELHSRTKRSAINSYIRKLYEKANRSQELGENNIFSVDDFDMMQPPTVDTPIYTTNSIPEKMLVNEIRLSKFTFQIQFIIRKVVRQR